MNNIVTGHDMIPIDASRNYAELLDSVLWNIGRFTEPAIQDDELTAEVGGDAKLLPSPQEKVASWLLTRSEFVQAVAKEKPVDRLWAVRGKRLGLVVSYRDFKVLPIGVTLLGVQRGLGSPGQPVWVAPDELVDVTTEARSAKDSRTVSEFLRRYGYQ